MCEALIAILFIGVLFFAWGSFFNVSYDCGPSTYFRWFIDFFIAIILASTFSCIIIEAKKYLKDPSEKEVVNQEESMKVEVLKDEEGEDL